MPSHPLWRNCNENKLTLFYIRLFRCIFLGRIVCIFIKMARKFVTEHATSHDINQWLLHISWIRWDIVCFMLQQVWSWINRHPGFAYCFNWALGWKPQNKFTLSSYSHIIHSKETYSPPKLYYKSLDFVWLSSIFVSDGTSGQCNPSHMWILYSNLIWLFLSSVILLISDTLYLLYFI